MEKQVKLVDEISKDQVVEMPEPEIKIVRNTFMITGAMVKEEIIRKTWIIPRT